MKYRYKSTKNYGNEIGLSCCFRQPNATHSHCSLLHGYSLGFKFVFGCNELDDKNWCADFGGTKWIKAYLEEQFDHTWAIDSNDPLLSEVSNFVYKTNIASPRIMDGVGCEKFAEHVFNYVAPKVDKDSNGRVQLLSVECYEHGANSAIYEGN